MDRVTGTTATGYENTVTGPVDRMGGTEAVVEDGTSMGTEGVGDFIMLTSIGEGTLAEAGAGLDLEEEGRKNDLCSCSA